MDWGKAKNILIVTFLFINFLLGYQIYLKQSDYFHHMLWFNNNLEELQAMLDKKNITLETGLPKEIPEMYFIQVRTQKMSPLASLDIQVNNQMDGDQISSIIKNKIPYFNEYQLKAIEESQLVYYQEIDGFPIWGANLNIYLRNNKITHYTQYYAEVLNKGMSRQVVTSYAALNTVLEHQMIPNQVKLTGMMLGYYGPMNKSTVQVLTPVWMIQYQIEGKEQVVYVNALTGGVENVPRY